MDVLCVEDSRGNYFCTEFFIKFRIAKLDQTSSLILGSSLSEKTPSQISFMDAFPNVSSSQMQDLANQEIKNSYPPGDSELVDIYCNNKLNKHITAFIGENLMVHFYDPKTEHYYLTPDQSMLFSLSLMKGKNIIKCVHRSTQTVKSFAIWLFNKDDRFVIMDIDGTITKSDLRGYVTTVYMGLYSYVHDGVIEFLNYLVNEFDYKILYLTARPMAHRNITEDFLKSSKNELGQQLPEGPLLTSRDRISLALYKEVVLKESALTKADILNQVILAFRQAGNTKITPFVLGIGNKETDAIAYNSSGLSTDRILLIDPSSKIQVWKYSCLDAAQSSVKASTEKKSKSTNNSGYQTPVSTSSGNHSKERMTDSSSIPTFSVDSNPSISLPIMSTHGKQTVLTETSTMPWSFNPDSNEPMSGYSSERSSFAYCKICGNKDGGCSCQPVPPESPHRLTSTSVQSLPPIAPPSISSQIASEGFPIIYSFNTYKDENLQRYVEYLHSQTLP